MAKTREIYVKYTLRRLFCYNRIHIFFTTLKYLLLDVRIVYDFDF